jgi:hypothetical protein
MGGEGFVAADPRVMVGGGSVTSGAPNPAWGQAGEDESVKLCQDLPASWRRAMDLGLTARSGLANRHKWVSWMLLRLPPTFLLRLAA